jgi:hypothetical protein
MTASQRLVSEQKKLELESFFNELKNISPQAGGFEEIGALLALPEEHFAMIAPAFLSTLEKDFNNVNDKMLIVQAMNLNGLKIEQIKEQYESIYKEIDL